MEGKGKKVDRDLGACNCDRSDKLILKGVLLLRAPVTAAWTVQSADFDKARPHQEFRTAWSCVESRKCVPNRLHHYCSGAAPLSRNLKLLGLCGKSAQLRFVWAGVAICGNHKKELAWIMDGWAGEGGGRGSGGRLHA